jgi:hypothetical protein
MPARALGSSPAATASRGPKTVILYVAPTVALAVVGLLSELLTHACR